MSKSNNVLYGVECPHCLDIIVSRHRHDMRWCKCNKTAVDGGTEYTRVSFKDIPPKGVKIEYIEKGVSKAG